MEIVLTQDHKELFKMGHVVNTPDGETYTLFPYWIRTAIDGRTYLVSPDKLPYEVKKIILAKRNK